MLFDEPGEKIIDIVFDHAEAFYFGKVKPTALEGSDTECTSALPSATLVGATVGEALRRRAFSPFPSAVTRSIAAQLLPNSRLSWLLIGAATAVGTTASTILVRRDMDTVLDVSS